PPTGGTGGYRTTDLLDAIATRYRLRHGPLALRESPYQHCGVSTLVRRCQTSRPRGGDACTVAWRPSRELSGAPARGGHGDPRAGTFLHPRAFRRRECPESSRVESNHRPLPCQGSALPLSYT